MNKIKEFRGKHGISQRKLALLLKVNHRTLQRWESGELNPRPIVFELLARLDTELAETEKAAQ